MNDLETQIYKAVHEADENFHDSGATSTKTWIRDFFLPAIEKHGLVIRIRPIPPRAPRGQRCCNKAVRSKKQCVCMVIYECPDHGEEHIGTHD